MVSIPALPSPSSAQPLSGLAKVRQMLASDAIPVQPIRRVPGEEERRRSADIGATGDALQSSKRTELDETGERRARRSGSSRGGFTLGGRGEDGPVTPGLVPLTATPNAGFVTQSIHQEAMGAGLHIEPWSSAIQAYRRADAGPDTGALVSRVAV